MIYDISINHIKIITVLSISLVAILEKCLLKAWTISPLLVHTSPLMLIVEGVGGSLDGNMSWGVFHSLFFKTTVILEYTLFTIFFLSFSNQTSDFVTVKIHPNHDYRCYVLFYFEGNPLLTLFNVCIQLKSWGDFNGSQLAKMNKYIRYMSLPWNYL